MHRKCPLVYYSPMKEKDTNNLYLFLQTIVYYRQYIYIYRQFIYFACAQAMKKEIKMVACCFVIIHRSRYNGNMSGAILT